MWDYTVVTLFKNLIYNVMKGTGLWLCHTQVLMTGEHNIQQQSTPL
jgi:hypothetical protein